MISRASPTYSNEPLAIIEEEARAMAVSFGISTPEAAAECLVDRIVQRLGGTHVYLPKKSSRERQATHVEIAALFNGTNLFELAKRYGMTPRHVRRILTAQNAP